MPRKMFAFFTAAACGVAIATVAMGGVLAIVHIHATPPVIDRDGAAEPWETAASSRSERKDEDGPTMPRIVEAPPAAARSLIEAPAIAPTPLPDLAGFQRPGALELTAAPSPPIPDGTDGAAGDPLPIAAPAAPRRPEPARSRPRDKQGDFHHLSRSAP